MSKIREALQLLEDNGWCKGQLEQNGAHCIMGAIWEAHGVRTFGDLVVGDITVMDEKDSQAFFEDIQTITRVVNEQYPEISSPVTSIPVFNDHPNTDFVDVGRVLEKAALRREEMV